MIVQRLRDIRSLPRTSLLTNRMKVAKKPITTLIPKGEALKQGSTPTSVKGLHADGVHINLSSARVMATQ